jgi:hypothetical protein
MSDTGDPAVEEKPKYVTAADLDKFADKMTSHFGRIVTKQMDEKYMPKIKESQIDPEQLKEQLSTEFLTDPEGTINKMLDKREQDRKTVADKKLELVSEEMKKFEDRPLFSETQKEIEKLAGEALEKGYPPGPAVELAYEKAKSNHLINRDPDLRLAMSPPGSPKPREKKTKMPQEFKAAAQRDIAAGLFKDEQDYLDNLSQDVKARYGL